MQARPRSSNLTPIKAWPARAGDRARRIEDTLTSGRRSSACCGADRPTVEARWSKFDSATRLSNKSRVPNLRGSYQQRFAQLGAWVRARPGTLGRTSPELQNAHTSGTIRLCEP